MKCKNLKIKSKKYVKYLFCNFFKKEIKYENCQNCPFKEYKQYNTIKSRTNKLAKKEKDRFSIIYRDLTKCCVCGSKIGVQKNEIFEGSYRTLSIKYGMVAPMCYKETCHKRFHDDIMFNLHYKVLFQKKFMETHTLEEFIAIFKQDYIYKLKKR